MILEVILSIFIYKYTIFITLPSPPFLILCPIHQKTSKSIKSLYVMLANIRAGNHLVA